MFGNIQPVTKNILLLNIAMALLTAFFDSQGNGIDLGSILGAHYFGTPLFQPYQVVSHFFMHQSILAPNGGFLHIFMNMYVLVIFGSFLERLWGPKRFFIFYVASALGAYLLYAGVGFFQIMEMKRIIGDEHIIAGINGIIKEYGRSDAAISELNQFLGSIQISSAQNMAIQSYVLKSFIPMVGASGAIFGVMAAFAILFPNTQLMLIFPPIPIKAKWLIGGYFVFELYNSFQNNSGDNVAHLAHVGGAIVGAILVLIWRRTGKNFY
ncbi:rhomboid family intramembrane serine protease [Fluviicola taffensis]|uniref:rhomboid family intramembrane serine protease n=1 Tax=Fluviicola taffensis TaxID=191579 RepID=UPI0031383600